MEVIYFAFPHLSFLFKLLLSFIMGIEQIKLNNGVLMPSIGLGTAKWKATDDITEVIKNAIDLGYRHFDSATLYGNQKELGEALKQIDVPRKDLFIVSKVFQNNHRPERMPGALEEILKQFQMDYIDLLLLHWPYAVKPEQLDEHYSENALEDVPIMDTWRAMEALVGTGKVRAIGVSNFNQDLLDKMVPQCRIVPAVNQVEIHPYLQSKELVRFCKDKGIHVTAYRPFGGKKAAVLEDGCIQKVAKAHSCSPSQVALSWALSCGVSVIPKSTNRDRMELNLKAVALTSDEKQVLDRLDKNMRDVDPYPRIPCLEWVFHEDRAKCPLI